MATETELKLRIHPEDKDKFMQHPLLQTATQSEPQHLYNTYFDTKKYELLNQGIGLRVRKIGERYLQTIKTAGSSIGGLHQRQEWENEIERELPEYERFPKEALPPILQKVKKRQKVKPIFTTDFTRITWDLHIQLDSANHIEIALDQGEIITNDSHAPISEIELELKSGDPEVLFEVAKQFLETVPLSLEAKSKAQRGYALHQAKPLSYYKAEKRNGLIPKMSAEAVFETIVWQCLKQVQANEDMVLYGDDIEGVHQMRVGLRRLRSCLSVYKPLIPKKTYEHLWTEFKWITSVLGVARDWDVFNLTLQEIQEFDTTHTLQGLQHTAKEIQLNAYVEVRKAIRSPRYTKMLLELGEWMTTKAWRNDLKSKKLHQLDAPVIKFASEVLQTYRQLVLAQGEDLRAIAPEQRHEIRIEVKKLGYSTRFFAELYPCDETRLYVKTLSQLQDELGILNDANVAMQLLTQAGLDQDAPARHFLHGWYAHQQYAHFNALEIAWQQFITQKKFW